MDCFIQWIETTIVIKKKLSYPISPNQSINKATFTLETKPGTNPIKLEIFPLTKPILNTGTSWRPKYIGWKSKTIINFNTILNKRRQYRACCSINKQYIKSWIEKDSHLRKGLETH